MPALWLLSPAIGECTQSVRASGHGIKWGTTSPLLQRYPVLDWTFVSSGLLLGFFVQPAGGIPICRFHVRRRAVC